MIPARGLAAWTAITSVFLRSKRLPPAGSFEGYTTIALGVRARLPHRVFTLYDASTNRSRLVIDVAHR